jgi:hypothetical protein
MLHLASEYGQVSMIHTLHRLGADVNAADKVRRAAVPLRRCPPHCSDGVQLGMTPAYVAAQNNRCEALRALHSLGADLRRAAHVSRARQQGSGPALSIAQDGALPLHVAAVSGHVEAVRLLLKEAPGDIDRTENVRAVPARHCSGPVATDAAHRTARLRC